MKAMFSPRNPVLRTGILFLCCSVFLQIFTPTGASSASGSVGAQAVPSVPVLLSPASGSLTTDYTPTLDWGDSTPAPHHYQLQVDDNSDFSSKVINNSGLTTSKFTPGSNLTANKRFYWRVRAYNAQGQASAWSSVWSFRTALTKPSLLAPAQGSVPTSLRPTFDWSDVSGATGYTIVVSKYSNFSTPIINTSVTGSRYTPGSDLPRNTKLYWRVRANGANPSAWAKRDFTSPTPPTIPVLVSPANNALFTSASVLLDWNASTPTSPKTIDHYQLQVDINSCTFATPELNLSRTPTNYTLTLTRGNVYCWRVRAYDSAGQYSSWSAVRSLKSKMSAPTLVSPTGGAQEYNPVSFHWNRVNGATSYTIQLSTASDFSSFLLNTSAPASAYIMTSDLPMGGTIYWRVRGLGTTGPSNWSAAGTFMPVVPGARHGGWADEIAFSPVASGSAIAELQADAIDIFSPGLASGSLQDIENAGLCHASGYWGYYDILSNPATFYDTDKLNPFADHEIREAMNWLIDRDYINQQIYGAGSLPKYTALTTQLVDYTGVVDVARSLEAKYGYDPVKAGQVITAEMESLGATLGPDSKWQFNGQPVVITFLIRNDGDGTRLPMGDYVADQLESVGFTVDRQYKTASQASPLWIGSDPKDGLWNIYTAGWISAGLQRDQASIFQEMYLNTSAQGIPLFLENVADPTFQQLGDDLAYGNFTTLAQRHDMIAQALPLSLEDSLQVWLVDVKTHVPFQCDLSATYDLGSGVETAQMALYATRFKDVEGGTLRVGTNELFTDPWNPVDGGNWVWDLFVRNGTQSASFMTDPFTGLAWPLRAESAAVTVQTGLPVGKSLDWLTLSTAAQINVPAGAWVDWDGANQVFITRGEKFPGGLTAKTKVVVTYPADMFQTVKWHDGSNLSAADFVMRMIMAFDRANPGSAIYDESAVPAYDSFLSHFKGLRITSTDPLVIEYYDDLVVLDAELIAAQADWWPRYRTGEASWQAIAVANAAEAAGELAYSPSKAGAAGIEWTNFVGGSSLDILNAHLDTAIAESSIPYYPTLSQYITPGQAAGRYASLKAWYRSYGHFWDTAGPYFLDWADLGSKTGLLKDNPHFPDPSGRWASFSNPPLADAAVTGPAQVTIGQEGAFDLAVTTKASDPYPSSDIKEVKFLVYDDQGETVYIGEGAPAASDGLYTLTIPADVTAQLEVGSYKIEAAVVLVPVAIPSFSSADFVMQP